MAVDKDDCVSYACECVRLAGLTDDEVIREQLLRLAVTGSLRGKSITATRAWPPPPHAAKARPGVLCRPNADARPYVSRCQLRANACIAASRVGS
jgi:hypothetical protein